MVSPSKSKLKKPQPSKAVITHTAEAYRPALFPLSRRDEIASRVLAGLCANESYINEDEDVLAANALIYADALLEKLDGKKGTDA